MRNTKHAFSGYRCFRGGCFGYHGLFYIKVCVCNARQSRDCGQKQLGMLNATHLVKGQLSRFKNQLVVMIWLINVATGVVYATYEDSNIDEVGDTGPGGGLVFFVSEKGFDVYDGKSVQKFHVRTVHAF